MKRTTEPEPRALDARPRRFQKRRREVLDASVRLFSERGYDGTSLLDIAEAVGLLKGSLYYYARSKEDLLAAIVEEVFAEGTAAADELRTSAGSPAEKLERSLERAAHYMLTHRAQASIYFNDAKALSQERLAALAPERASYVRAIADQLRAGQRSGDFRDDLDPRIASIALIGSINWLALQESIDAPAEAARTRFVKHYCDHLMNSVAAKG